MEENDREVDSEKPVVLTVDDEDDSRNLIVRWLEDDYVMIEAANSEEAMQVLAGVQVDIVLTDSNMPNFSGYELCRQIRKHFGNALPVIFVSANGADVRMRIRATDAGANAVIAKPFRGRDLRKAVQAIQPAPRKETRESARVLRKVLAGVSQGIKVKAASREGDPISEED